MLLGVDVASIDRIARALQRRPRFAERIYTERERQYCATKPERWAARWAAKEAVRKLYGSAREPIPAMREIEVGAGRGAPHVRVRGEGTDIAVSLTHDAGVAIAVVAARGIGGVARAGVPVDMRLPARPADGHKGTFGHVLVVAGARGYTGAPQLAALGAARGGAGLVTVCVPEAIYPIVAARCLEVMPTPLPDGGSGVLRSDGLDVLRGRPRPARLRDIGLGARRRTAGSTSTRIASSRSPPAAPAMCWRDWWEASSHSAWTPSTPPSRRSPSMRTRGCSCRRGAGGLVRSPRICCGRCPAHRSSSGARSKRADRPLPPVDEALDAARVVRQHAIADAIPATAVAVVVHLRKLEFTVGNAVGGPHRLDVCHVPRGACSVTAGPEHDDGADHRLMALLVSHGGGVVVPVARAAGPGHATACRHIPRALAVCEVIAARTTSAVGRGWRSRLVRRDLVVDGRDLRGDLPCRTAQTAVQVISVHQVGHEPAGLAGEVGLQRAGLGELRLDLRLVGLDLRVLRGQMRDQVRHLLRHLRRVLQTVHRLREVVCAQDRGEHLAAARRLPRGPENHREVVLVDGCGRLVRSQLLIERHQLMVQLVQLRLFAEYLRLLRAECVLSCADRAPRGMQTRLHRRQLRDKRCTLGPQR